MARPQRRATRSAGCVLRLLAALVALGAASPAEQPPQVLRGHSGTESTGTSHAPPASIGGAEHPHTVRCQLVPGRHPKLDAVLCEGRRFVLPASATEAAELVPGSAEFYVYLAASLGCIVTAALAAGLTMGLVSLDAFDLDLLLEMRPEELASDKAREELLEDQRCATALKPLIADHFFSQAHAEHCVPKSLDPTNKHYLLVTLLIVNALANEALPVFLDHLVPAWAAVVISVSFVLVFGEIIPSAIFTGPSQLSIATRFAEFVAFLKLLLTPLVWPISLLLDKCLDHEAGSSFSRGKIKALVRLHEHDDEWLHDNGLTREEIDIIHGTLDLHKHMVGGIQESMNDAKMLPITAVLDEGTLADILHWGHSRIFVYDGDPGNIRGILLVKRLIVIDPGSKRPLSQIPLRKPCVISAQETLLATLNRFQTGHSHLAIISADPEAVLQAWESGDPLPEHARPTGFLTLEDVFEELIREDVLDEAERSSLLNTLGKAGKMDKLRVMAASARKRVKSRKFHLQEAKDLAAATAAARPSLAGLRLPLLGRRTVSEGMAPAADPQVGSPAVAAGWQERLLNNIGSRPARRSLAESTIAPNDVGRPARRALAEE